MHEQSSLVQAVGLERPGAPGSCALDSTAQLDWCLDELAALPGADAETCRWLHDKLSATTFNLVVAGQFKRGKSTLINALLGESLLPVGVVPLTSVVTVIRSGPTAAASVEFMDGQIRELPPEALEQYATERGNPGNRKGVRRVEVRFPCAWLGRDVRLIDTPGIDSIHEHNTEVTRAFMPQADAVIFVASVEQPLSRAELEFLQSVRPYATRIFCVLNKIDQLNAPELQESLSFCTDSLTRALGVAVRIFPVSARAALQAPPHGAAPIPLAPGFHELQQALQTFMLEDQKEAWRRSVAATLLRLGSQARATLQIERSASSRPLGQLQDALATLGRQKELTLRAQVEHSVLLQAHVGTLLHEQLEPALARFRDEQQLRIAAMLQDWHGELRNLPSRRLQAALEQRLAAEVRAAYDGWLRREEPPLGRALDELCGRFWSQTNRDIDQLLARCGELFGLSFEPIATSSVWRYESGFDYRFWTEPTTLLAVSSLVLLALPRTLGGPLIMRRLRARALDLMEVHAGRLRADLEQRLGRSVHEFHQRLMAHVTRTIEHIEEAVRRGIERYTAGEAEARARAAQLDQLLERLDRIEARCRRLAT